MGKKLSTLKILGIIMIMFGLLMVVSSITLNDNDIFNKELKIISTLSLILFIPLIVLDYMMGKKINI